VVSHATQSLLSVQGIEAVFELDEGVVRAVDGVSFDIEVGQVVALVGESGCGKTVTARSILQLLDPPGRIADGKILLRRDGSEEVTDLAELHPDGGEMREIRGGEIALIFQEPMASFSPVHTVGSQIQEAVRLHRDVTKREARAETVRLLGEVGVPDAAARFGEYPYQFSGGMLQRAMIAMALSCRPRLLIADEPTTALDVTTQAQILALLRRLQRETGMAIIFITHNLGVVAEMADVVVVMYLGTVAEKGPVEAIYHAPKHPYTRALLRSIPPVRGGSRHRLETIAGSIPHPLLRPPGCPFHPRCPRFMAGTCDKDEPGTTSVGPGHEVRCFLYGEEERP